MTAQQLELTPRAASVSPETKRIRLEFHAAWVERTIGEYDAHASYVDARDAWHTHVIALDVAATKAALAWWQSTKCGDPNREGRCPCLSARQVRA